jgi:outer membrane protein assembly factor BamA
MRSLILVVAAVAAGAWMAIHYLPGKEAQAQVQPAEVRVQPAEEPLRQVGRQIVQSIAIDGGRNVPYAAMRARLSTRVGDPLDARRLEQDRSAIEEELAARGYLAAKVAPASVTFGANGGAYVVFDVEAGRMFHLRSVVVTGPGRRDADVVTLATGDEATHDRIVRARQALADTFARRGGKQVELTLRSDPAAAAVDVELATR